MAAGDNAQYGYSENDLKAAFKNIYTNVNTEDQQAFLNELKQGQAYGGGQLTGGGSYEGGYYVGQDFLDRLKAANDPNDPATKERNRQMQLQKLQKDMPGLDAQTVLGGGSLQAGSVLGGNQSYAVGSAVGAKR